MCPPFPRAAWQQADGRAGWLAVGLQLPLETGLGSRGEIAWRAR